MDHIQIISSLNLILFLTRRHPCLKGTRERWWKMCLLALGIFRKRKLVAARFMTVFILVVDGCDQHTGAMALFCFSLLHPEILCPHLSPLYDGMDPNPGILNQSCEPKRRHIRQIHSMQIPCTWMSGRSQRGSSCKKFSPQRFGGWSSWAAAGQTSLENGDYIHRLSDLKHCETPHGTEARTTTSGKRRTSGSCPWCSAASAGTRRSSRRRIHTAVRGRRGVPTMLG